MENMKLWHGFCGYKKPWWSWSCAGTAFWSHAFEHIKAHKEKDKTQPSLKHKHGSDNRENECIKPDVLTSSLH